MKEKIIKIISIAFGISLLILPFILGMPYIIGFIAGSILVAKLILFPSPVGQMLLNLVFKNAYNDFKVIQNEHEKNTKTSNKYRIRK